MDSIPSDADLIARSVLEPATFGVVYERHAVAVRQYVTRRVGSEAGEDLAAEVFVRAFRARERYRADYESSLPWLLGVSNHVIAGHRRTEQRRLQALQRLAGASNEQTEYESRRVGSDVVRELRRLPDADRDALLLLVWGELSYEEVSIALEVPVGTVASRVARARRQLSKTLRPRSPHDSGAELARPGLTHV
jgi:RNA polymerase sigma factor (sigma-70 family)